MDKQQFEAIVAACVRDPRKLAWLEGFVAGVAAAAPAQEENTDGKDD